jgi:hypothetical protein
MTIHRFGPFVGALALAAGLTACGGGVSKSGFVSKADGACAPGNATLGGVAKPTNLPELATAAGTVVSTVDAQAAALRKLKAPGDDKAAVAGVVGALAEVAAPARSLQEAAGKSDDAATARAVNDLKAKADAASTQASTYGLAACAVGLKGPVDTVFDGGKTVIKAAFVARADALCTAANKKADALNQGSTLAAFGRYLVTYIPIEEKLFADIKGLVTPPGDESTVSDMLAAQDKVIANDKEAQAAAQKGNTAQVDRLGDANNALVTQSNSKFDAYGLKNCGTLGSF